MRPWKYLTRVPCWPIAHPRLLRYTLAGLCAALALGGCDGLSAPELVGILQKLHEREAPGAQEVPVETLDPQGFPVMNDDVGTTSGGGGDTGEPSGTGGADSDSGGGPPPEEPPPNTPPSGETDTERLNTLIAEADLVHKRGDHLFALSAHRGLSIIDLSSPESLKLLGEHPMHAQAFEMVVQDHRAVVMLRDLQTFVPRSSGSNGSYERSSAVVVLDIRNPTSIIELDRWNVPGKIVDSRKVGDYLHVVSYQNRRCWRCSGGPNLVVASYNLGEGDKPSEVDRVQLRPESRSWRNEPSLMATDKHLYIATSDRNRPEGRVSSIRTIDISDPTGRLRVATPIDVAGEVTSRWQMSEHEGVLRVVSQPGSSRLAPTVETFSVEDLDAPKALGSLQLRLPRPESLRAVRFDKTRAYAITFERTDPLFTLDLSDPRAPRQVGELEIPGWVMHMTPRGDRLIGIGYDPQNTEASLNASLFDVSDMSQPRMIKRVNFGGSSANFTERQNQIHKALRVWDDEGLVAVPYTGYSKLSPDNEQSGADCSLRFRDEAVALIDWKDDTLKLRGIAKTRGIPRRSLLHKRHLLTVSDEFVQSHNIEDRDKPSIRSDLRISASSTELYPLGKDYWLRRSGKIYNGKEYFDIVSKSEADKPGALSTIEVDLRSPQSCERNGFIFTAFEHDQYLYFVLNRAGPRNARSQDTRWLIGYDVRDRTAPRLVDRVQIKAWGRISSSHQFALVEFSGQELLQDGDRLYISRVTSQNDPEFGLVQSEVNAYRLKEGRPQLLGRYVRPPARYVGALYRMAPGVVSSWYAVPSDPDDPAKITFHWQRFSPFGATSTKLLDDPVSGIPLIASPHGTAMLALGFDTQRLAESSSNECYSREGTSVFIASTSECFSTKHRLDHFLTVRGAPLLVKSQPLYESSGRFPYTRLVRQLNRLAFQGETVSQAGSTQGSRASDATMTHLISLKDTTKIVRSKEPSLSTSWQVLLKWLGPDTLLRVYGNQIAYETLEVDEQDATTVRSFERPRRRSHCFESRSHKGRLYCPQGTFGIDVLEPTSEGGLAPPDWLFAPSEHE